MTRACHEPERFRNIAICHPSFDRTIVRKSYDFFLRVTRG
ncbi:hypothetical protein LptCag_0066 [Leptospirillum ferriphilum]|uniref:Uncharacterized protein n=1 Tax=Leptospirillum ferriphilum TaxID=178606 RepID=A0A094W7J2_9BACT|nr:hypothetical protein LptCag_0066 [Leptospirillum ferriphilum]